MLRWILVGRKVGRTLSTQQFSNLGKYVAKGPHWDVSLKPSLKTLLKTSLKTASAVRRRQIKTDGLTSPSDGIERAHNNTLSPSFVRCLFSFSLLSLSFSLSNIPLSLSHFLYVSALNKHRAALRPHVEILSLSLHTHTLSLNSHSLSISLSLSLCLSHTLVENLVSLSYSYSHCWRSCLSKSCWLAA